jgi:hypothetical protein
MAFTSLAGGQSGKRTRRDRNSIVGLSGWLFADLLLGLAVIFLVASDKPTGNECMQRVPDVIGRTAGLAKEIITYANFIPIGIAVTGGDEPGVVYMQDPVADECAGLGVSEVSFTYEPLSDGRPTTEGISLDGTCKIVLKGAANASPEEIKTIFGKELARVSEPQNVTAANKACYKLSDGGHKIGFILMFGYGAKGSEVAKAASSNVTEAIKKMGLLYASQGVDDFAYGAIRAYKIDPSPPSKDLMLEIFVLADGL